MPAGTPPQRTASRQLASSSHAANDYIRHLTSAQVNEPLAPEAHHAKAALAQLLADWFPGKVSVNPETKQARGSGVIATTRQEIEARLRMVIVHLIHSARESGVGVMEYSSRGALVVPGFLEASMKLVEDTCGKDLRENPPKASPETWVVDPALPLHLLDEIQECLPLADHAPLWRWVLAKHQKRLERLTATAAQQTAAQRVVNPLLKRLVKGSSGAMYSDIMHCLTALLQVNDRSGLNQVRTTFRGHPLQVAPLPEGRLVTTILEEGVDRQLYVGLWKALQVLQNPGDRVVMSKFGDIAREVRAVLQAMQRSTPIIKVVPTTKLPGSGDAATGIAYSPAQYDLPYPNLLGLQLQESHFRISALLHIAFGISGMRMRSLFPHLQQAAPHHLVLKSEQIQQAQKLLSEVLSNVAPLTAHGESDIEAMQRQLNDVEVHLSKWKATNPAVPNLFCPQAELPAATYNSKGGLAPVFQRASRKRKRYESPYPEDVSLGHKTLTALWNQVQSNGEQLQLCDRPEESRPKTLEDLIEKLEENEEDDVELGGGKLKDEAVFQWKLFRKIRAVNHQLRPYLDDVGQVLKNKPDGGDTAIAASAKTAEITSVGKA